MKVRITSRRDSSRHYLCATARKDATGYQYHMMEENTIPGLLPSELRRIDNGNRLFYDVTEKENLFLLHEGRKIPGAVCRGILEALLSLNEKLEAYLLDPARVLLDPRLIYHEGATDRYYFLYYPEDIANCSYETLFSYLAAQADPAEQETAMAMFRLLSLAQGEHFVLTRALCEEIFPKTGEEGAEQVSEQNPELSESFAESESEVWEDFPLRQVPRKVSRKVPPEDLPVLLFFSALFFAMSLCVRFFEVRWEPVPSARIVSTGAIGIFLLCAFLSAAAVLYRMVRTPLSDQQDTVRAELPT